MRDMMNIIEKYIFKKRNVYITNKKNKNMLKTIKGNDRVRVEFVNLNKEDLKEILFQVYGNKDISEKYSNRNSDFWKLIVAFFNDKPAGAFWILEPNEEVLYDSFVIYPDQILFCSVFVNPNFRGKSLYNFMHKKAFDYWKVNCLDKEVITIVEKNNIASNKSNKNFGLEVLGVNYLIKFFGRNIISIFKTNDFIKIWFLYKEKKTKKVLK